MASREHGENFRNSKEFDDRSVDASIFRIYAQLLRPPSRKALVPVSFDSKVWLLTVFGTQSDRSDIIAARYTQLTCSVGQKNVSTVYCR